MGCTEVTLQPALTNASKPARNGVFKDPRSKINARGARSASTWSSWAVAAQRSRQHDEVEIQSIRTSNPRRCRTRAARQADLRSQHETLAMPGIRQTTHPFSRGPQSRVHAYRCHAPERATRTRSWVASED